MASGGDPQELGQLLRSRRERLTPAEVGLPTGTRRRTAGLRREEVALLANLSTTYYTFLEQGRPVRPSVQILDALAAALRMSEAEHRYLLVLGLGQELLEINDTGATSSGRPEVVDERAVDLVQRLEPFPTLIKGRRWDVLAANPAARELFGDWDGQGNLLRWMLTSDMARAVYLDWEPEARAMLGRFRIAAARHPGDPDFKALVDELLTGSTEMRSWWPQQDVASPGSGTKKLWHPRLGTINYSHVVLQLADEPDQTMDTYSAE
ncbi:MAG: helix-turn-helix transcriptional regulator [Nakamurella sp.]